jgi:hypothetical protein
VEQPTGSSANSTTEAHVTNTSGPSPPSPAPPAHASHSAPGAPHSASVAPHSTPVAPLAAPVAPPKPNPSPPIPNRNNMRNRVELDSVSPGIEAPNPLASPVSPNSPTRPNFSYPARAPPPGVPRQVPVQPGPGDHLQQYQTQHDVGHAEPSHPAALIPGQPPPQSQLHNQQKHPTLANLKLAAAGIHVSAMSASKIPTNVALGCWRSFTRDSQ